MKGWVKEPVAAREFGWRREDGVAYVGQRTNQFWMLYVRRADGSFKQDDIEGYVSPEAAMRDFDIRLEAKA